jgi:hypothetical protein
VGFHVPVYLDTYFKKSEVLNEGSFLLAFDHPQKDIKKSLYILKKVEQKGKKHANRSS